MMEEAACFGGITFVSRNVEHSGGGQWDDMVKPREKMMKHFLLLHYSVYFFHSGIRNAHYFFCFFWSLRSLRSPRFLVGSRARRWQSPVSSLWSFVLPCSSFPDGVASWADILRPQVSLFSLTYSV